VRTWLRQFHCDDQDNVLRETAHLIQKCYISRQSVEKFINDLLIDKKFSGSQPKSFWQATQILSLQTQGRSQSDMVKLLKTAIGKKLCIVPTVVKGGTAGSSVLYLDDVICTGNRLLRDLKNWLQNHNVTGVTIHVVTMGCFEGGRYHAENSLSPILKSRQCKIEFWASRFIENRKFSAKDAETFWPHEMPNDPFVERWRKKFEDAGHTDYFFPRPVDGAGSSSLFSSERSRQLIESAFMRKGAYIWSLPQNPHESMRPLGYSKLRTPGFGATVITYRNCPNNAPLVLWWGDPNGSEPLCRWTPLFPRRVN
jgi:hypothetical protein